MVDLGLGVLLYGVTVLVVLGLGTLHDALPTRRGRWGGDALKNGTTPGGRRGGESTLREGASHDA